MKWANPHAWIYIDVAGKDGKVEEMGVGNWRGQRAVSTRLEKEDLVAGTVLVIDGYQARNGSKTANATSITFENGKRLFAGSSSQNSATK